MEGSARGKPRILILDDHPVVRRGVKAILAERLAPLQIHEGAGGKEGFDLALRQPWDLVIAAIDLPDREGLALLAEFTKERPGQAILVLTVRVKIANALEVLEAGAKRHVEVVHDPEELVSAARRVLARGTRGCKYASHESLSNRELEVLRLIGLGWTVKAMAAALALSGKTVSTYRSRILVKLGLKTTAELIRYAVMHRLSD